MESPHSAVVPNGHWRTVRRFGQIRLPTAPRKLRRRPWGEPTGTGDDDQIAGGPTSLAQGGSVAGSN